MCRAEEEIIDDLVELLRKHFEEKCTATSAREQTYPIVHCLKERYTQRLSRQSLSALEASYHISCNVHRKKP